MNRFNLFIVTRERATIAAHTAIESLLRELINETDVVAFYNETESLGQFQYWSVKTSMNHRELHTAIHEVLNNFNGDDDLPWYMAGHHPRKIRRHQIVRVSVIEQ